MSEPLPSGMGDKKESGIFETILPALVNALVVFVFQFCGVDIINNAWHAALLSLVVAVITFGLQWSVGSLFQKIRRNRNYGKYEGRWLQIIPDMPDRPYTIFTVEYNEKKGRYEIDGYNFDKSLDGTGQRFRSYRLVERSKKDGFYYITDRTSSGYIGLGKLYYEGDCNGLTRAYGFFCDVDNGPNAKKYDTIMVKCNEQFWKQIMPDAALNAEEMNQKPYKDILKISEDFAKKEIDQYRIHHKASVH